MALSVDAASMLTNLAQSVDSVRELFTAGAFIIGSFLIFSAVYQLKSYGEARSMMSSAGDLKKPISLIMIGIMLMYLPTAFEIILTTAWGTGASVLQYQGETSSSTGAAMHSVLKITQLVGLIAFIRGWIILAQGAKQGGQPQFAKAMAHIIGGVLAINIIGTKEVISATFGLSW